MRRLLLILLSFALVAAGLHPVAPVAAADPPEVEEGDGPQVEWGDLLVEEEDWEPPCEDPPCEPVEVVSTGGGGYIPLTPDRLASLTSLRPGVIDLPVAGEGGVPEEGVGAVVLNLAVSDVGGEVGVFRWAGRDRVATAAAVSQAVFAPGVEVAFVATGANFPDALAGGPAGGVLAGPILLTGRDDLPAATAEELARLTPQRVVVLGGPAVISKTVETKLAGYSGGPVERWAGSDRFATAAAVSRETFPDGADVAFVATGANFPDALAGGPAGGILGGPILLSRQDRLPEATATELARLAPRRVVVLGGEAVVAEAVLTALGTFIDGTVERWAGPDRFATAAEVAAQTFADGTDVAFMATGANYPDALAGGPGGWMRHGPILLTHRDRLPEATRAALGRLSPRLVVVLGGASAVSEEVLGKLTAVMTSDRALVPGSAVTLWAAGALRPPVPNLAVDATRDWSTVALVEVGAGGAVSLHSRTGEVDVDVDVLGWFPPDEELFLVHPQQVLATRRDASRESVGPNRTIDVAVAGVGDVPASGVAAVALGVTATDSLEPSGVTVWPKGEARPASPSLITEPQHARQNLVIVAPGADGRVSVHNEAGRTHLSVTVLGWLPDGGAYRPLRRPGELLDTTGGASLATGTTLDLQVAGRGGVPGDDDIAATDEVDSARNGEGEHAHSVVLNLSAPGPAAGTAVTVFASATGEPAHVSMAAGSRGHGGASPQHPGATVTLALVPLGDAGKVSLVNHGPATHLRVQVVGWFATPAIAAELHVPETTLAPEEDEVLAATSEEDGRTIHLAPGADVPPVGGHLVVGITEDTPDGHLGEVIAVTAQADGSHLVRTRRAGLDEAFPQGEISVNFDELEADLEVLGMSGPDADGLVTVTAASRQDRGLTLTFKYEGKDDPPPGLTCNARGASLEFGPTVDMDFAVKWGWFKPPTVTALLYVGAQAEVTLKAVNAKCTQSFRLMKKGPYKFMAGSMPIVVSFEAGAVVGFDAGLANLEVGAMAEAAVVVGIKNSKGYANGWTDYDYSLPENLSPRDLKAYAMLDLSVYLHVQLYEVIGPKVSVGPFVETFLTTNEAEPWLAVDTGLAAKIELKIDLGRWYRWSATLYDMEIPLARWLVNPCKDGPNHGEYGPGFTDPDPICATKKPATRASGAKRNYMAERFRLVSSGEPFTRLGIAEAALASGHVATSYTATLEATGLFATGLLSPGIEWTVVSGQLPPGLTLGFTTGTITGTPTMPGAFTFTTEAWYAGTDRDPKAGPYPATRELTLLVDCTYTITDGGDTGKAAQLRQAVAKAPAGGLVCLDTHVALNPANGPLPVPRSMTVDGRGYAVSGGQPGPVLRVEAPTATLHDLGITGGAGAERGGGVTVQTGRHLVLTGSSVIEGNSADLGGGVYVDDGGAVTLRDTASIRGNTAQQGGGLYAEGGSVTLGPSSSITGNTAQHHGGGIFGLSRDAVKISGSQRVTSNIPDNIYFPPDPRCTIAISDGGDDGKAGQLRQVVQAAGSGDTICLGVEVELRKQQLVVDKPLTILGFGNALKADNPVDPMVEKWFRVLQVDPGVALTLDDVRVTGGMGQDAPSAAGGGIWVGAGAHLVLRGDTEVFGNANPVGDLGGGVALDAAGARLTLRDSATIRDNYSGYDGGGGVFLGGVGSTLTLRDSATIRNNRSWRRGGGVYIGEGATDAVVTLTGTSSISDNQARGLTSGQGGGISQAAGTVQLEGDSMIEGNQAGFDGGGVHVEAGTLLLKDRAAIRGNTTDRGGGIFMGRTSADPEPGDPRPVVRLSGASTVTGNVAWGGGGIWQGIGDLTLEGSSTITGHHNLEVGAGIYHYRWAGTTLNLYGDQAVTGNTPDNIAYYDYEYPQ
jgi:putative cell wall-binding protein